MIKIAVSASRNYNVIMERGALAKAGEYALKALGPVEKRTGASSEAVNTVEKQPGARCKVINDKKLCIVTDANVDHLYGQPDQDLWESLAAAGFDIYKYVFPGGEAEKNMDTIAFLLNYLADNQFTRSDGLLALGGGITGDITGYAAASFLRGIEFIQVPTSLLAIVDSSVGGKTGVNLNAGKNLAGAFWQPSLVLFDPDVLATLPAEQKLDGAAEAIKAGCIADPGILEMIETAGHTPVYNDAAASNTASSVLLDDDDFLTKLAARAVEVKRQIVEKDERESGVRQLLNFGHTAAHAIEKCSSYTISHGHAVAMGMAMISAAAEKAGWTGEKCHDRLLQLLVKFRFPLDCPYSAAELTAAALQDKKRRGDFITLIIPETIGRCVLKSIPVTDLQKIFALGLE